MKKNTSKERARFLAQLVPAFSLSLRDAQDIIESFHGEMGRGLAGEQSALKMLPTFVGPPTGMEKGRFLALDLGGTNCRVLAVDLDGKRNVSVAAASRFVIPDAARWGAGEKLFDFMADCLLSFLGEHPAVRLPDHTLAFTFSFPVEQRAIAWGMLIEWTKGFTASGVVGRDVVALLSEAMKRRGCDFIRVTALTNDTVGTLVAERYSDPSCDVGVILGTGTNACYPERIARIPKHRGPDPSGEMIVNMEWGNFAGLKANRYDAMLDAASPNQDRQRLEKMVSGMYLGEVARLVIRDMMEKGLLFEKAERSVFSGPHVLGTEHLSLLARGHDFFAEFGLVDVPEAEREALREIGRLVSTRSARIATTAIAAVVTWLDPALEAVHTVAIDGSLFEKYPGFRDGMLDLMKELFGGRAARIRLVATRDGSAIGSAIVGAVASYAR